ncbi:MAG: transcriptional regulator, partial [Gammaproteobacteria bacterium]
LGYLVEQKNDFDLTPAATDWMTRMGIDVAPARAQRRKYAPRCLDWSERRPHLAGALGSALLTMLASRKVVRLEPGTRQVHIPPAGRRWLARHLQVPA